MQEDERFAALQRELEDAHGEYRLRRLDEAARLLDEILPTLKKLSGHRYKLLEASARSLRGRIHWRQAEKWQELNDDVKRDAERTRQADAFRESVKIFREHESKISQQHSVSRFYTDYGIALYRTDNYEEAIRRLELGRDTGATPADGFAYLGLTYRSLGKYREAIDALEKGLQLAPGDKILMSTLAETLDDLANKSEMDNERPALRNRALRTYCLAAVACGKEDDLLSARKWLRAALSINGEDPQALSMLTLLLRSQGNDAEAASLLEQTLAISPSNPWALGLRGMLLRDQGCTDEAIREFRKVEVDHSPELAWVWLEHAKTVARADVAAAAKLVQKAERLLGENDPQVRQVKAFVALQKALAGATGLGRSLARAVRWVATAVGESSVLPEKLAQIVGSFENFQKGAEVEKEIAALSEALQLRPDHLDARVGLIQLLLERKEYVKADTYIAEGLDLVPDSARLLLLRADLFERQERIADAIRHYRMAARGAPNDETAFIAMIDALRRAGRVEEALREAEYTLSRDPNHGAALFEKGKLLLAADKSKAAADCLRRAETILHAEDPRLVDVRTSLGRALSRLELYEEAKEVLARAARADSEMCSGRVHYVDLLIDIAEYEAAARIALEAIDLLKIAAARSRSAEAASAEERVRSQLAWFHYVLGWALHCGGKATEAEIEKPYRVAIEMSPNDPWIKKGLGGVLLRTKEKQEEGRRLISELVSATAVNKIPVSLEGWCHYLLRDYEAAEHWLRAALAAKIDDCTLQFDLGLVLLADGRPDATAQFKSALQLASGRPTARRRGLLNVALLDLIISVMDGRIGASSATAVCDDMFRALEAAGLRSDMLTRLRSKWIAAGHDPQPAAGT
jgi:tetratricopeptide (TPR) repeat protein